MKYFHFSKSSIFEHVMQGRSESYGGVHITRTRDDCELFVVVSGDLYIKQGDIKYHLKGGDYLITERGTEYGGYEPYEGYKDADQEGSGKPNLIFYFMHFKYSEKDSFFGTGDESSDYKLPVFGSLGNISTVLVLMSLMNQYSLDRDKKDVLSPLVSALLRDICTSLLENSQKNEKNIGFQRILNFFEYNPHCNEIHDLKSMAEFFGYSEKYLIRLFKKNTGMPPIQYLTEMKMEKARELLADQKMSVKEIAASLHYDYYYFMRLFKRRTGMSPEKFRKTITPDYTPYVRKKKK